MSHDLISIEYAESKHETTLWIVTVRRRSSAAIRHVTRRARDRVHERSESVSRIV